MLLKPNAWVAAALLGIALMWAAPPAWVHHSGAMFDRTKVVTIHGIIREFVWTNPHSSFKVDVAGADGAVKTWLIEMNSPNNLVREGWKRTTLKPGTEVTVAINPLRDGRPGGWYVGVAFPDGKSLGDPHAKGESVPSGEAATP